MTQPTSESAARFKILIVEDDPRIREILCFRLEKEGQTVTCVRGVPDAIEQLHTQQFEVVLLDIMLGAGGNGLDVLREVKNIASLSEVILVTAVNSVEIAAEAMRLGALAYIPKPIEYDDLLIAIRRAGEKAQAARQELAIRRLVEKAARFPEIVTESPAMADVLGLIKRAAAVNSPVLLLGETGTGKELVARTVHLQSPRNRAPFVPLNCAGVPETLIESELFGYEKGAFTGAEKLNRGLMEIAHGGTLFLDELEEMSAGMQAKLLRVLDSGEFRRVGGRVILRTDVRIIAATNQPPTDLIKAGRLREDLYYRLGVVTITIPPLRERKADIGFLARYFTQILSRETVRPHKLSDDAVRAMERYPWPGNVRELRNMIERLILITDKETIEARHLPPDILGASDPTSPTDIIRLADIERHHILKVIQRVGGNRRQAAKLLDISEMTLYRRLKEYGIST